VTKSVADWSVESYRRTDGQTARKHNTSRRLRRRRKKDGVSETTKRIAGVHRIFPVGTCRIDKVWKDKFWAWSGRRNEWSMVKMVTKEMMKWYAWDQIRPIKTDEWWSTCWRNSLESWFKRQVMPNGKSGCSPSRRKKVDEQGWQHPRNECCNEVEQRWDYVDIVLHCIVLYVFASGMKPIIWTVERRNRQTERQTNKQIKHL